MQFNILTIGASFAFVGWTLFEFFSDHFHAKAASGDDGDAAVATTAAADTHHRELSYVSKMFTEESPQYCSESYCNIQKILISGDKSVFCPDGYHAVPKSITLNGDINQGAGGADIFLCISFEINPAFRYDQPNGYFEAYYGTDAENMPITNLKLVEHGATCGVGWSRVDQHHSNGDLNQSAGGKDIFLCFTRREDEGSPIKMIYLRDSNPPEDAFQRPEIVSTLTGDLNQAAGGRDIFLQIYWTNPYDVPSYCSKIRFTDISYLGGGTGGEAIISFAPNFFVGEWDGSSLNYQQFVRDWTPTHLEFDRRDPVLDDTTIFNVYNNPSPSIVLKLVEYDWWNADDIVIVEVYDICNHPVLGSGAHHWYTSEGHYFFRYDEIA